MNKSNKIIYIFILVLILGGCQGLRNSQSIEKRDFLLNLYIKAVEDASLPEPQEVWDKLTIISKDNPDLKWQTILGEEYVLMVTWKAAQDTVYYLTHPEGLYNTGDRDVWVTAVPDLMNFVKENNSFKSKDYYLRLQQVLGLPPSPEGEFVPHVFMEFWVRPQDLFRPCPDAEIDDNLCDCVVQVPESEDAHNQWIRDYRNSSYSAENPFYRFPWTQLGYTYDWNPENQTHIGLSEFVIKHNADIYINKVYPTAVYIFNE